MTIETFTTAGFTPWVCPTGVTSVFVQAVGSGVAGLDASGGIAGDGGVGGGYAEATLTVVPGTEYAIIVGDPTGFTNRESIFDSRVYAYPRGFGTNVGDVTHEGGSSGTQGPFGLRGGGGGGAAGPSNNGGTGATGDDGGGGGTGHCPLGGGAGDGGTGGLSGTGSTGSNYGGGGGGGGADGGDFAGGVGSGGIVVLTYTVAETPGIPGTLIPGIGKSEITAQVLGR